MSSPRMSAHRAPDEARKHGVQPFGVGLSDVGRKRLTNEDAFLVDNQIGLYVVADGMGGHSAGEVASEEAVDTLHGTVRREADALAAMDALPADITGSAEAEEVLRKVRRVLESAVQAATYMVYGLSEADPERKGMGTTMSALLVRGHHVVSAQVGDSRIYLVRDGVAHQITEDHTLVAWQVKKGLITEEEARHSRQKNVITRAVGSREYVQVDTFVQTVAAADAFLLCSDGLHGYIDDTEVAELCQLTPQDAVERAIELANERGGRDNITAVVVQLQ